jgi:pyrophosphate--fructose-6-phosphate 1-phosphotransferase
LKTHPNLTLIAEELGQKKTTLAQLTNQIADVIAKRAENGKNYGVIIIPEGVIEFIPEMKALIAELNQVLAGEANPTEETALSKLKPESREVFSQLPWEIRRQLIAERDPHGNVQVSLIETEKLLIELVERELKEREKKGAFKGKFSPVAHFLGYEGRCGFPSNFDCNYCYSLGYSAALLIDEGVTGYMAYVEGLHRPPDQWTIGGLPIVMLLHLEQRAGKIKPVIRKALVNMQGKAFQLFADLRDHWALDDDYQWPGPMQFAGDVALINTVPMSLTLEA